MPVWDFDRLAPVLHAVGMAAAKDEPLDFDSLAAELGGSRTDVEMLVDQIDRMGLIVAPREEPEFPPA
jgi:biotin operon repressor